MNLIFSYSWNLFTVFVLLVISLLYEAESENASLKVDGFWCICSNCQRENKQFFNDSFLILFGIFS